MVLMVCACGGGFAFAYLLNFPFSADISRHNDM
jgi:hypothetical protein